MTGSISEGAMGLPNLLKISLDKKVEPTPIARQSGPPPFGPLVERTGVRERRGDLRVGVRIRSGCAERAEEDRVIHTVRRKAIEQIGRQLGVSVLLADEA